MARAFAPSKPSPLIICDGGVESVLAAAHAAEAYSAAGPDEAATPVLWCVPPRRVPETAAAEATERLAKRLALRTVQAPAPRAIKANGKPAPEAETLLLVRACTLAGELGLRRVVWPVRRSELDESARAFDRAVLVSRLASMDAEASGLPEIVAETPFVDLTDEQVGELVEDIRAPIEACWWTNGAAATTDEGLAERRRWGRLIGETGFHARAASHAGAGQVGF